MERPNFFKLFLNLLFLLFVIVVILLFVTGTLQDKWRSWREEAKRKAEKKNPPVVMISPTITPTATATPTPNPTATAATFTPYSQRGDTANDDLPKTGPGLNAAVAGGIVVTGSSMYYYVRLKRRLKKAARDIEVL